MSLSTQSSKGQVSVLGQDIDAPVTLGAKSFSLDAPQTEENGLLVLSLFWNEAVSVVSLKSNLGKNQKDNHLHLLIML